MSESTHDEAHTGPIKNPKQLLVAVLFSFVIPIFAIIGLVLYVTSADKPAAGAVNPEKAIAERIKAETKHEASPEGVVVTSGAKQALFNACFLLFGPGDRVLIPAPYWTTYPALVKLARAEPVIVPTSLESGFRASIDDLNAKYDPSVRGLIINSPSNPTGRSLGRSSARSGRRSATSTATASNPPTTARSSMGRSSTPCPSRSHAPWAPTS